ncbi:DUF4124 domain-containing protein [Thiohalobacter sp. IOR34]|nr:DUF4124 domain-containing protein [Thiohalobacter sp. IOR34]WJW75524.1 DUF4124 domain-containing protein [Thiohalobacter sp. IOR34]
MRSWLAMFGLALLPLLAEAAVYKWVDENGTVHFSDKPHPNAEQIRLPKPSTYTPPPLPSSQPAVKKPAAAPGYERLQILEPQNDATIRNDAGEFSVRLLLQPDLRRGLGHRVLVELDGKVYPLDSGLEYRFRNIDRGSHVLRARVVDGDGKELIASEPLTFHLLRHSAITSGGKRVAPTAPAAPQAPMAPRLER